MPRKRFLLTHREHRSILTDMLPFEVPPTFSNAGFYRFLRAHSVTISGNRVHWSGDSAAVEATIRLLFGVKAGAITENQDAKEWGKPIEKRSIPLAACRMDTTPFSFRISHNVDGRVLSVVHPRNQIQVASFYAKHSSSIIYYASMGEFSIRRPVSVSRYSFFKDRLHEESLDQGGGVEESDKEYEQLGSYFVYKEHRNIHRFFESYRYHRCEKKYGAMVQVDISKCFNSIYTHSLPWAILGKNQTKFELKKSKTTFAGRFDALMQNLNQRETNGIVIGPEFSRVFAELILQSIDSELQRVLKENSKLKHRSDYEIFRYVDDYFIFYNDPSTELKVVETLREILKSKKLNINSEKIKRYERPIITEITIAKERISSLLNEEINPSIISEDSTSKADEQVSKQRLLCAVNSNRLIIRYKTIIKLHSVKYEELLNYTFAIIENKIAKLIDTYLSSDETRSDEKHLIYALRSIFEFSFFAYAASPKVNHSIRICRMISTAVEFLHKNNVQRELKHVLFKYIHDNILLQLGKNTMSSYREVESLYLLTALAQTGKEYWLPLEALTKHFEIKKESGNATFSRTEPLNCFSITVLLSYMKHKKRYVELRDFIERHAIEKMTFMKAHYPNDAEGLMLFLDLIVCPYVSNETKLQLASLFGLSDEQFMAIQNVNEYWFTKFGAIDLTYARS